MTATRLIRLYHSAPTSQLGWDNLPWEISRCQKTAEGRRTGSVGKLSAGISCAKLAIRARSRPIFRRCSIFIRYTQAELTPSRPIMTGGNSANVAINSLMRRRNFRQPSFVHYRKAFDSVPHRFRAYFIVQLINNLNLKMCSCKIKLCSCKTRFVQL